VTTTKALALALGLAMATVTTILSVSSAFAENPPTVTAVLASSGPTTGGQRVTVEGTNLDGASAVDFGDDHGQHGHDGDDDRTAGAAGTVVDVTVTTASGTSGTSPADRYSFGAKLSLT